MKKAMALILAAVLMCGLLAGCGGGGQAGTSSTPPAGTASPPATPDSAAPDSTTPGSGAVPGDFGDLGEPVSLTLGHLYTTTDYRGAALEVFAARCAELSGGNITITLFPSQTLTTSQDAMKSVAAGIADMAVGSMSFNVSEVPALLPLDITGIYDPAYFDETIEIIMPVLDEILATQNQKGLWYPDETNMVFYLNEKNAREVHAPSDVAGLRLRDHGMWIGKSISSFGASPMTVMPADLTVALERGTVDGGYTGWGFAQTYRCHEVAPHISYTELAKSCFSPLTINLDVWNGLTEGQQAIILQAVEEMKVVEREELEKSWEAFQQEVTGAGGSIYVLTQEENQAFVDAAAPLIEEARGAAGELGNKLIDALLSAPSNYR